MEDKEKQIKALAFITFIVILAFVLRLWQLQILKGDQFRELSERNRVSIVKIPAPRGIIYDRKGKALVKNAPFFVASLLPEPTQKEINMTDLSALLKVPVEDLSEKIIHKKTHSIEPIPLKRGLTFEEVAKIEARRADFPGLIIETEIIRDYPYNSTAAHLIGYLSRPSDEQMKTGSYDDSPKGTYVGRWGVEALFNERLQGKPGIRYIEVDALGRQLHTLKVVPPQRGEDIHLSIDIKAQIAAERAFKKRSGALLALDPENGEILALVSLPSFDPNLFVRGISPDTWRRYIRQPGHPFLNRVFQSRYPPGSVFKLITAIAALEEGVISKDFKVNCTGQIHVGKWTFRCWKKGGHGLISLKRAIVESCDVYFYEVGRLLGIDRIAKYAQALGLDRPPGVHLSAERAGLIPSTKWKRQSRGKPWYLGETFNAAIGQGYVSLTPAQVALLISAIASDGKVFRPSLTVDSGTPEPIAKLSFKPQTLKILKNALVAVVNSPRGTGRLARSDKYLIAGKTGTAQVVRLPERNMNTGRNLIKDHAWFVAYAPAENPEIALSVFVEHGGHGGTAAAPIARKTIEAYLDGEK